VAKSEQHCERRPLEHVEQSDELDGDELGAQSAPLGEEVAGEDVESAGVLGVEEAEERALSELGAVEGEEEVDEDEGRGGQGQAEADVAVVVVQVLVVGVGEGVDVDEGVEQLGDQDAEPEDHAEAGDGGAFVVDSFLRGSFSELLGCFLFDLFFEEDSHEGRVDQAEAPETKVDDCFQHLFVKDCVVHAILSNFGQRQILTEIPHFLG
jgi:hypothetical protein